MTEYATLTGLIAPELGMGWQTGADLTFDVQPIAATADIRRNWNAQPKNLVDPEFMIFSIRISSGEAEYRPPALVNMWPGRVFHIVPPNLHTEIIPVGATTCSFPREVYSARGLTLGFDDVPCSFSGRIVTLSAPATETVRISARMRHQVMVVEPWTESYQERLAESRWTLSTEDFPELGVV